MSVLREKLLSGRTVALAGGLSEVIRDALLGLDAQVAVVPASKLGLEEDSPGAWAQAHAPLHALVYDARGAFGEGGEAALSTALEEAWVAIREVATGALIPAQEGGKLVLVAPRPDAGPLAGAARAGLENLARTLSVEWARHGMTVVMLAPGATSSEQHLALLVCFLVSEGGAYLSGCRLELGAI